ncbi:MAG: ZIP family metal transporter [Conexivisphaerales archaeon]
MDFIQTSITGAIAGLTIFISLPAGKIGRLSQRTKGFVDGIAIGILAFLFYDVTSNAINPIELSFKSLAMYNDSVLMIIALVIGFGVFFIGLSYYSTRFRSEKMNDPFHLSTLIASGIGIHNFGEGLAIGASASEGLISLAILLVIGFALHNSTEGFGIVAPLLSSSQSKTSWLFLFKMGLIGGGPTIIGSMIGFFVINRIMYVALMSAASGAILFVVLQLYGAGKAFKSDRALGSGVFIGFVIAFITDIFVSTYV